MDCKDVQRELANRTSELPDAVLAHVAACPACRSARSMFNAIDDALGQVALWQPPAGFAERLAAKAAHIPRPGGPRSLPEFDRAAAAAAVLVAVTAYLSIQLAANFSSAMDAYAGLVRFVSQSLVAHTGAIAGASAAVWFCISAWFTRKALLS